MRFRTVADPVVLRDLSARLSRLTPDTSRCWGTLSAHEMLCHLGDATAVVLRTRWAAGRPTAAPPAELHCGMLLERRRWRIWLGAAGLAATIAGGSVAAQPPTPGPTPPPLMADLLRGQPSWRLLDPTSDLVGDYTITQLEELDRWPPWLEQDFDRDGRDDIAAVVVRRGEKNEPEFTVVVVHGATPNRAVLVVPFSRQRIFGVSEGIKDDTVMPLRCADCDANVWYRWNGRSYEPWLHTVGESVRISGETGGRLTLFESPRPDAGRTGDVPLCSRAQIQEVGGEENRRWYRVEVVAPSFPKGWVPQQLVREGEECGG